MQRSREYLKRVVRRFFDKPDVQVIEVEWQGHGVKWQNDLELMISWRLMQSARSAAKRSRQIRLTVQAEAVRRYAAASQDLRQRAHTKLVQFLREQLAHFHPEHDTPIGLPTPVERWSVGTRALFG